MVSQFLNNSSELDQFRKTLLVWENSNFRFFPWRITDNPYAILIAEIMLHRTQVKQVLPVYNRFLSIYPDIKSIVDETEENIRLIIKPLGLHWRVPSIKKMATEIYQRYDSSIPMNKEDLNSLPGISDYIASAVRCFAWNLPDPLIDTNTVRIVGRIYGVQTKDSSRRNQFVRSLIENLIDRQVPAKFNYALLDLAHLVCHKKKEPECRVCPISSFCNLALSRYPEIRK